MLIRLFFLVSLTSLFIYPVQAATFIVNSTLDSVDATPGDGICLDAIGDCTLRAAIQETNALAGADTINLPAGTFNLTIANASEDSSATGDLDINGSLTLAGAGAHLSFIDGQNLDRVFDVGPLVPGITVSFSNMVIRSGSVADNGGIIKNAGTLTLTEVSLENGQAAFGGALYTSGDLTVNRSLLRNSSASTDGGGFFQGGATTIFSNSTFSGNTATGNGGGMYLATAVTTTLDFSTVAFNTAAITGGGGLYNAGTLTLNSSILANNTSENCASNGGSISSDGTSLDSGNTCGLTMGVDLVNTTPSLGVLFDNGGETATHALSAGSFAIDAGNATCPGVDQRNVIRPVDGNNSLTAECDIGAYEWTPAIDLQVNNNHVNDCVKKGKDVRYLIGVSNIGSGDASSVVLTDILPASTTFVSVSAGCTHTTGVITCDIGALAAGATQNFDVVVNAPVTDYLSNVVSVTAAEQDDDLTNNSAEENTRINCSACFIATAAYGSSWTAEVMGLRNFRDQYLFPNKIGRKLVLYYYEVSPIIAEKIRHSDGLRIITRVSLAPFVFISKLLTNTN